MGTSPGWASPRLRGLVRIPRHWHWVQTAQGCEGLRREVLVDMKQTTRTETLKLSKKFLPKRHKTFANTGALRRATENTHSLEFGSWTLTASVKAPEPGCLL